MVEMEESFGALISQLPSDTEVPGLLEDITNKGLQNGLSKSARSTCSRKPAASFTWSCRYRLSPAAPTTTSVPLSAAWPACRGLSPPRLHDPRQWRQYVGPESGITAKTYRYKDGEG
jgi:type IV pilus assembly protein PilO